MCLWGCLVYSVHFLCDLRPHVLQIEEDRETQLAGSGCPSSPPLLPDLSHVQVQPLERAQSLNVLCIEGHVHHNQPAGAEQMLEWRKKNPKQPDSIQIFFIY